MQDAQVGQSKARYFPTLGASIGHDYGNTDVNGEKIHLRSMLLNTIGNNKGFSDNNAEFTLK